MNSPNSLHCIVRCLIESQCFFFRNNIPRKQHLFISLQALQNTMFGIDGDSVEVESTPDTISLCDNNSNNQAQVTCRISKENVNPKPTFSYSSGGPKFDPSRSGTVSDDGNYYQSQVSLCPGACGENQVTCRVNNIVLYTCQYMAIIFIYRSEFFGYWGK